VGRVSSVVQTDAAGAPLSAVEQGFTISTNVPYICGVPVKQAGFNSTLTSDANDGDTIYSSYDNLCRVSRAVSPGGQYDQTYYSNIGSPGTIRTTTPSTVPMVEKARRPARIVTSMALAGTIPASTDLK
jgi:hypothetical protein